jgi:hypothetical protein
MSQQSDMADIVYNQLSTAPVSAAHLVRELRSRWGIKPGVSEVHFFVCEVVCCLLHRDDVQAGDMAAGRFVSWKLEPWEADDKMESELMAMDAFLEDKDKYVFQKRPSASQRLRHVEH